MSRPDISKPLFGWGTALNGQGDLTGMKEYKNSVLTQNETNSANSSDAQWGMLSITTGFTSQNNDIFSGATASVASVHGVTMSDGDNFGNVSTNSATGAIEVNSAVYGTLDYGSYGKSYGEMFGDVAGSFLSEMSNSNTQNTNGFSGYGVGMSNASSASQRTDMYGNVIYTVGMEERVDIGGTSYRVNMDGSQTQLDLAGNPITSADNSTSYGWGISAPTGWGITAQTDASPSNFYGPVETASNGWGIAAPAGWGSVSPADTGNIFSGYGNDSNNSNQFSAFWAGTDVAAVVSSTGSWFFNNDANTAQATNNNWLSGGNKQEENNFYNTDYGFWNRSNDI